MTYELVAREWHSTNKKWSTDHSWRVLKPLKTIYSPAIGSRNIRELNTRNLSAPIKAVEMSGRFEVVSRLQQRKTQLCAKLCKVV